MAAALKRLLDIAGAVSGLVLLAPLLAVVAALVRLTMGPPVLFRQERTGRGGRPFVLFKFRTMRDGPGSDGERLTRFGRLLRRTSLDELPQLWNVLRGDMSLVGPRPLPTEYTPYYTARERLRLTVRPGLTGLAQLNGRNLAPWDRRLADDVRYVEGWSLWLDCRLLLRTVRRVLWDSEVVVDPCSVMLKLSEERRPRRVGDGELT